MTNAQPTDRDLRIFALLLLGFFAGLAALTRWRPDGLVVAAAVLGVAWIASLALNRDLPWVTQRRGVLLPALFLAAGAPAAAGIATQAMAPLVALAGLTLSVVALASPRFAAAVHRIWMDAALPVGWSISRVLLAAVWYGVVTPIGIGMRLLGRDPIDRRIDLEADSYWIERQGPQGVDRYFRQF